MNKKAKILESYVSGNILAKCAFMMHSTTAAHPQSLALIGGNKRQKDQ